MIVPKPGAPLSEREREIMRLIAECKSNHEIATALFIAHSTVKNHITAIYAKTGATSRVELALMAYGLVEMAASSETEVAR